MSKGTEYLRQIVRDQKRGIKSGIYSICSANDYVLKAAIEFAREKDRFVLIEATANQVNQYGGYTGMTPAGFRDYVQQIAAETAFPVDRIILGGDHLGPLVWKGQNEEDAMAQAEKLIHEYVAAGFEKIHIDTSMRLGDDPTDAPLLDATIAARAARLCAVAEKAHRNIGGTGDGPVYVIGSEVPVPGGTQAEEGEMKVTSPQDFENTIKAFSKTFHAAGLSDALERVIAIVVQPGVEFGDDTVDEYISEKAKPLVEALDRYPGLVFEGHSTDYQTKGALRQLVTDGIAILKVGPALTFALREALFGLSFMEDVLFPENASHFIDTLDQVMLADPIHWEKYYQGDTHTVAMKRKYSYSDRWRYYYNDRRIQEAIHRMFGNLDNANLYGPVMSQFMFEQYTLIQEKRLLCNCCEIIKSRIKCVMEKYDRAVRMA